MYVCIQALWTRVSEVFRIGFTAADVHGISAVSSADIAELERITDSEVPDLRRAAGPTYNSRKS
jgi:hypothetical protein